MFTIKTRNLREFCQFIIDTNRLTEIFITHSSLYDFLKSIYFRVEDVGDVSSALSFFFIVSYILFALEATLYEIYMVK